ncbi:hypothetical protein ACH5RR_039329 [Cinchona calisaya]|uniref:Uncharacterized protein n=1 Tax=Cinchona calisaya TaxID=153742 RepID=A0ABD2XZQ6_9GENT
MKSTLIFPHKCSRAMISSIETLTGMHKALLPIQYLDCPLFLGWNINQIFNPSVTKIRQKLDGWVQKLLPPIGRLVLIKHVLMSISIHILSVMDPPKQVILNLECCLALFLWEESD